MNREHTFTMDLILFEKKSNTKRGKVASIGGGFTGTLTAILLTDWRSFASLIGRLLLVVAAML